MPGLLDGLLTPVVGAAFGWLFLDGSIFRRGLQPDGKGGFVGDGFGAAEPIKIAVESATEDMRLEPDFSTSDVALMILAYNSATGVATAKPKLDDEASVATGAHAGRYHLLRPIRTDAAGTHYIARGRMVK